MRRFRLTAEARSDLDEIWLYVAQSGSPGTADGVIDGITEAFLLIARMPEAGRRRDDLLPGVRSFPMRQHVIYYTRRESTVVVLRVLHGARDTARIFGQS